MNVIDMRCRPAYLHDFFGATPGTAAYESARWLNRRVGSRHDEHFTPSLTREGFLQEVHAAGLRHAVVVGRHTPGQHLPNDRIQQIVADDPVLLVTMIFFSSLAFSVLESAMAVIFHHRKADHKRHFLVSVAMPYIYILCLCVGLLLVTLVSGALQLVGRESVDLLGRSWSLSGVSGLLLYLLGLGGEIFMLTSLYLVMPAGRMSLRHALLGGITAALLWEATRRVLIWYFSTLSQVNVVYGSLTTAIVVLLSLEIAATLVLLGAQVIAQYERLDRTGSTKLPESANVSGEPAGSLRPGESPRR